MADKAVILCAFALLIQSIVAHWIGSHFNPGFVGPLGADSLALTSNVAYGTGVGCGPYGAAAIAPAVAPASGGGFPVTSTSPIVPTGLAVLSENLAIDGGIAVGGNLPFLGTAGVDGVFPNAGAGVVSYGCGDGAIGITTPAVGYRGGMPGGYMGCGTLY